MIGIYKITSPTGRIYIGQSINIKRRFDTYRRIDFGVKTSPKLHRSLMKYGSSNHSFEIIEECLIENLNERERYFQDLYNANSEDNLNCFLTTTSTKSGKGNKVSDAQKAQISKVHKGKVYSIETRNKIKIARAKQVITEDHKRKISENSGSARIVLNTQNGVFYNSAKEAAKAHGFKSNSLVCRLIGKIKNKSNLIYA